MSLLAIAAASAIRHFNPAINKKPGSDRAAFTDCVLKFFPWDRVTIKDDQHQPPNDQREATAAALYDVFRNPLVHSGGVTGKPHLSGVIGKWYSPKGLPSITMPACSRLISIHFQCCHALPRIERAITGIMAAIEDGMYQPAEGEGHERHQQPQAVEGNDETDEPQETCRGRWGCA